MTTDTVFDLCDAVLDELIDSYKHDLILSSMGEGNRIEAAINALEQARSRIKTIKDNVA